MAIKSIVTRIKNKVDDYNTWASSTGKLLDGEIAIVRVPTGSSYNPITGEEVPTWELLMKVGNGTDVFADLPWMSAKASDVYDWAKNPTAESIPFVMTDNGTNTSGKTLRQLLELINSRTITNATNISSNDTDIAANAAAITKLNGGNTTTGSVAKSIKDAIDALDFADGSATTDSAASTASKFVTVVTQTNGKIAVTKRAIAEVDLPTISASKIDVSGTALNTKLSTMDTAIAANTAKLAGHTDAAINTLIDNKINGLDGGTDSGTSGSGKYVSKVTQTNGKVATTYTSFPSASSSAAGMVKLGATGGAATYDDYTALEGRVDSCETDIASLKTSVAGGVHFIGTVTAKPTSASVKVNGSSTATTAVAGDIVLWSAEGIEYIYTGSAWEELGDVTRLGDLETKVSGLKTTATNAVASTHKFVSQVTQSEGQISVTYTQPSAADILYGSSSTVDVKLSEIDTAIAAKMDIHDHPYAGSSHTHGNITNDGKITSTAVTSATGVLVYDSSNKIQRATAAQARSIIGAGTSNLTIGTTSTTAAAGNHTHSTYDAYATDIAAIQENYVKFNSTDNKLYVGATGADEIIFDCGGAPV